MPLGFVPHPGGMRDKSSMFQHREEPGKWRSSTEGTAEGSRADSAVPSGLDDLGTDQPNVETLGYCRMSLRDKGLCRLLTPFFGLKSWWHWSWSAELRPPTLAGLAERLIDIVGDNAAW